MNKTINDEKNSIFTRIGGLALLCGLSIHIVVNMVMKKFPSEDLSLPELQTYLLEESGTWAIVHGLRYIALPCLLIFAASLFMRIRGGSSSTSSTGWGILGLLGIAVHVTNAFINNGIETFLFLAPGKLSGNPDLFWLLYYTTRTIATAEIAIWSVVIFGFSMAGLLSSMIPKWIVWLGILSAIACILSGVFIVSILTGGWAVMIIEIAALTGMAWFLCVGIHMLIKGNS